MAENAPILRLIVIIAALTIFAGCTLTGEKPAAREPAAAVSVDLPDHRPLSLPGPDFRLPRTRELNAGELELLKGYIEKHRESLGARGEIGFTLKLVSQRKTGKRLYVRFAQSIERKVGGRAYLIPIEGAGIVAFIDDRGLSRLNSQLMTPAALTATFENPGLRFNLSDSELATLMAHVKLSEKPRELIRKYFAAVASRAKMQFDFEAFLNRRVPEQRETLNYFFGSLSSVATARLLIDLAREGQLAMINHDSSGQGSKWFFQVTGFFHLPVEFDIAIPDDDAERLTVVNLRELHTAASAINGFQSPSYPGGLKTPGGESVERASKQLKTVIGFFNDNFGWPSYRGEGLEHDIELHTKLRSIDYRENAAWLIKSEKFVIGEGGESLANLEDSVSVLGHEYTHAVIQFSSGLKYRSDAGAINEHIADMMGALIESEARHGGQFTYHIGADILTPPVLEQKKRLSQLIIAKFKYSPDEVSAYDLESPSLRHLYAPKLSFAAQFDDAAKLRKAYPESCQPSVDNDNCGVHLASGVLNRAASKVINALGTKETRALFFDTAMYRLTAAPKFQDYLVQLYDECLETPELAGRCDVIVKSFASVGIYHPQFPELAPPPDQPIALVTKPGERDVHASGSKYAASPLLKFCGWVDRVDDDLVRLVDGKYDATIVERGREIRSVGDYQALLGWSCACAVGHITHLGDRSGGVINAFLDIHAVENRGRRCAADPELRSKRPPKRAPQPPRAPEDRTLCGWVSVNSKTGNITVIDGKTDATVVKTADNGMTPTSGDFSNLAQSQCACVTGKTASSAGATWFTELAADAVAAKPEDACIGIKWK